MNAREMLRYKAEASFRSGGDRVVSAVRRETEASPDDFTGSYVNLKVRSTHFNIALPPGLFVVQPLNTSLAHTSSLPQAVDLSFLPVRRSTKSIALEFLNYKATPHRKFTYKRILDKNRGPTLVLGTVRPRPIEQLLKF